eukprot:scaffold201221_cov20-Tisochrysis_lutea.AAC.1
MWVFEKRQRESAGGTVHLSIYPAQTRVLVVETKPGGSRGGRQRREAGLSLWAGSYTQSAEEMLTSLLRL